MIKLKNILREIQEVDQHVALLQRDCGLAIQKIVNEHLVFYRGEKGSEFFIERTARPRVSLDGPNIANLLFDNNPDNVHYTKRGKCLIFSSNQETAKQFGHLHVFIPKGNPSISYIKRDFVDCYLINPPLTISYLDNISYIFRKILDTPVKIRTVDFIKNACKFIDDHPLFNEEEEALSMLKRLYMTEVHFTEWILPVLLGDVKNSYEYFLESASYENISDTNGNKNLSEFRKTDIFDEFWSDCSGYLINNDYFVNSIFPKL